MDLVKSQILGSKLKTTITTINCLLSYTDQPFAYPSHLVGEIMPTVIYWPWLNVHDRANRPALNSLSERKTTKTADDDDVRDWGGVRPPQKPFSSSGAFASRPSYSDTESSLQRMLPSMSSSSNLTVTVCSSIRIKYRAQNGKSFYLLLTTFREVRNKFLFNAFSLLSQKIYETEKNGQKTFCKV